MVGEVFASLGAFKNMFDLAKGLKDLNDAAERNAVAIELQEKILATQAQHAALIESVAELEKQVADFEKWEAEKERYELIEFSEGQFAYALKTEEISPEPAHMLCTNCFDQNQKSILQTETRNPGRKKVHFCLRCSGDIFSSESGGRDMNAHRPTVQNRKPPR